MDIIFVAHKQIKTFRSTLKSLNSVLEDSKSVDFSYFKNLMGQEWSIPIPMKTGEWCGSALVHSVIWADISIVDIP